MSIFGWGSVWFRHHKYLGRFRHQNHLNLYVKNIWLCSGKHNVLQSKYNLTITFLEESLQRQLLLPVLKWLRSVCGVSVRTGTLGSSYLLITAYTESLYGKIMSWAANCLHHTIHLPQTFLQGGTFTYLYVILLRILFKVVYKQFIYFKLFPFSCLLHC